MDYSTMAASKRAVRIKETWRKPRGNIGRTVASFYSYMVLGMHSPAFGALIPYIGAHYNLSYATLSLIFLPTLLGFVAAAATTDFIHHQFGRRGIAIIGPLCQIVSYAVIWKHPPFSIVVVALTLGGAGLGLQDAAWNAYVGDLAYATQTLGLLHGIFGLGAITAPLIATVIVTQAHKPWYTYYYLMLCMSVVTLLISVPAFWTSTGRRYRYQHLPPHLRPPKKPKHSRRPSTTSTIATITTTTSIAPSNYTTHTTSSDISSDTPTLFATLANDSTLAHILALNTLYVICYVGVEAELSGWITTYMLRVRHADPFFAGLVASGFFLGLTLGRIVLAFVTPRIGERRAIAGYTIVALLLQIIFAFIPGDNTESANGVSAGIIAAAGIVTLQGFFLGPLFPAGIVVLTSLLPKQIHVQAIALTCTCGGIGGTVFPFVVGALAQEYGVKVLVPVLVGSISLMLVCWVALARVSERAEREGRSGVANVEDGEAEGDMVGHGEGYESSFFDDEEEVMEQVAAGGDGERKPLWTD